MHLLTMTIPTDWAPPAILTTGALLVRHRLRHVAQQPVGALPHAAGDRSFQSYHTSLADAESGANLVSPADLPFGTSIPC